MAGLVAYTEWNGKQDVQFVHNFVNTILKHMLYKNRIVERCSSQIGIITYRLPTCFLFTSVSDVKLKAFFASLHQVTAKRCMQALSNFAC